MNRLFTKGILVFLAVVFVASISGCNGAAPANPTARESSSTEMDFETTPDSTNPSNPASDNHSPRRNTIDLRDISSYWVKIESTTVAVGDPFYKFAAEFEIADYQEGYEEEMLEPDESQWIDFELTSDIVLEVYFTNNSGESMPVKDCDASCIEIDMLDNYDDRLDISFAGELRVGSSTREDVEILFGTPDFDSIDDDFWVYVGYYYITYSFEPSTEDVWGDYELWFTYENTLKRISMAVY